MNARMYTLNEITVALRQLAKREDSITALLKSGQFRKDFDACVAAQRAKLDTKEVESLTDRLVSIRRDDEDVYLLDDIQGVLSKVQFAQFMTFLSRHQVAISAEDESYIPVGLFDLFLKNQTKDLATEEPEEPDTAQTDDELSVLEFA